MGLNHSTTAQARGVQVRQKVRVSPEPTEYFSDEHFDPQAPTREARRSTPCSCVRTVQWPLRLVRRLLEVLSRS